MKKVILFYLLLSLATTTLFANFLIQKEFGMSLKDYIAYSLPYTKEEKEWLKTKKVIYYGADQSSPPLRYLEEDTSQYKGVVIDYLSLLSVQMRTEIQFSPYRWDDAIQKLEEGQTDLADMFVSPLRREKLLFSIPIYNLRGAVAYRDGVSKIDSKSDLKGKKISVAKGDYALEYLNDIKNDITIIESDNVQDAINLASEGVVDVVIGDEPVVNYYLREKSVVTDVFQSDWSPYENTVALGTSKQNKMLLGIVNKATLKLQKNGEVEKIGAKWMGVFSPTTTKIGLQSPSFILFVLAEIMGLIILFFFLFNRLLKKEVEVKTKDLSRNMEDLEHIFESIPEMKLIIDDNYKILNANQFFVNKIRVEKKDLIGKTIEESIELDYLVDVIESLDYVFAHGETKEIEIQIEQETFQVSCYPMKQKWDWSKQVIVSLKNITFQKYNEAQLLQINKMAAIGELASGVAHEIRNPLGLIRSYAYLLNETDFKGVNQVEIKNYLIKIDESTDRANNIINNLLNFSRITSDEPMEFNFYEFIKELISLEQKG